MVLVADVCIVSMMCAIRCCKHQHVHCIYKSLAATAIDFLTDSVLKYNARNYRNIYENLYLKALHEKI